MKFEIHEICEVNKWYGTWHDCEIVGYLPNGNYIINVFDEKSSRPDGYWAEFERFLRKKKYDGNELVSWEECIWRPEHETMHF